MFESFVEELIIAIIVTVTITMATMAFTQRDLLLPTILYTLFFRKRKVRISAASILRLTLDGKYLLVRNLQRKENFGPFGGVYKYYSTAQDALNGFNFIPQKSTARTAQDRKNDLRGFIMGKDFMNYIRWFKSKKDREISSLVRELKEELSESNLLKKYSQYLNKLEFKLVRTIKENLMTVPGETYAQFRWIDIYDLVPNTIGQKFLDSLFKSAENNTNLIIVTAEEIIKGRSLSEELIGSHTVFILQGNRTRPEDTSY